MKYSIVLILAATLPLAAQSPRQIVAISHRGEHLQRPENTIPAFLEAIRVGADFFEADVQTTSDGKLVLSHDATVDRCTDGKGRVDSMTFDQIEALDAGIKKGPQYAGTKIPTFDQVLDLARGKIGIYVDIKNATAQDLVSHRRPWDGRPRGYVLQGADVQTDPGPESKTESHARIKLRGAFPHVGGSAASKGDRIRCWRFQARNHCRFEGSACRHLRRYHGQNRRARRLAGSH